MNEKDLYYSVDKDVLDCNIYMMIFPKGQRYVFKYALAGVCDSLKKEMYCLEYKKMLIQNSDSILNKNGLILFNHYYSNDDSLITEIIKITSENLNKKVNVKEMWDKEVFILEVK